MTLLRNEAGALPLSPTGKVVVTGPSADSMTNQLGGWSVSWQGVFGAGHVCCMGPDNQIPPGTTVLKGIQAADPNAVSAPDQAAALAQAGTASAYVVAVGEKAYAEGLGDNPAPALPPDQQALITALEATGKPVIVVVLAGRPVGLGSAEKANGLVERRRCPRLRPEDGMTQLKSAGPWRAWPGRVRFRVGRRVRRGRGACPTSFYPSPGRVRP